MKMRPLFVWNEAETDPVLNAMLHELAADLPVASAAGKIGPRQQRIIFEFQAAETLSFEAVRQPDKTWRIKYSSPAAAARAVLSAAAGLEGKAHSFNKLGLMLDCSRDMVMEPARLKLLIRKLAMMGCNLLMLYTEDTYELPGEPYFGYLRGRYTIDEVKELDTYAAKFGIELIGCIQTLGHLEQILKWIGPYEDIRDTARVIRTDTPRTYELVEKMVKFWSDALGSRRIHVGMDETHDLGRGKYLDYNGWRDPFTLFNDHVAKVGKICKKHNLSPMIWSDMYFRMSNPEQEYYTDAPIPEKVQKNIPPGVELVYWDYYHDRKADYVKFIRRHRDLGFEPVMASGVWMWAKFWCDYKKTFKMALPCIEACREEKVRELFFTMWGDDGALCDWNSSWAGLCRAADLAYGDTDEKNTARRFEALCQTSYEAQQQAGEINYVYEMPEGNNFEVNAPVLLWDDPLYAAAFRNYCLLDKTFDKKILTHYIKILKNLSPHKRERRAGDIGMACCLLDFLIAKIRFRRELEKAYAAKNRAALKKLSESQLRHLVRLFGKLEQAMRQVYLCNSRPFGLEVLQIRNAGQKERLLECGRRIREFLEGERENIPELEESLPEDAVTLRQGWYRHGVAASTWWL